MLRKINHQALTIGHLQSKGKKIPLYQGLLQNRDQNPLRFLYYLSLNPFPSQLHNFNLNSRKLNLEQPPVQPIQPPIQLQQPQSLPQQPVVQAQPEQPPIQPQQPIVQPEETQAQTPQSQSNSTQSLSQPLPQVPAKPDQEKVQPITKSNQKMTPPQKQTSLFSLSSLKDKLKWSTKKSDSFETDMSNILKEMRVAKTAQERDKIHLRFIELADKAVTIEHEALVQETFKEIQELMQKKS